MRRPKFHILIVSMLALSQAGLSTTLAEQSFSPYVDAIGNINFPAGFDTNMVHLGSWFVPDGGASGFHGVYTEKKSIEAFRKTGGFPDGATLVKELRPSVSGNFTTGEGVSHATDGIKQWFVMVKDSKERFENNPIWGDGWGWALFKPDNPTKNVSNDYTEDCLGCHLPARNSDLVYSEAYPLLSR